MVLRSSASPPRASVLWRRCGWRRRLGHRNRGHCRARLYDRRPMAAIGGAAQRTAGSSIAPHCSDRRVERGQIAAVCRQQPLKARHAVEIGADRRQVCVVQAIADPLLVTGTNLELPLYRQHLLVGGRKNLLLALAPLGDRRRRGQCIESRESPTTVGEYVDDELFGTMSC